MQVKELKRGLADCRYGEQTPQTEGWEGDRRAGREGGMGEVGPETEDAGQQIF